MRTTMDIPEQASAAAAAKAAMSAGVAAGVLGAFGVGSFFALVILLCLKTPRTDREWAAAIISTVTSSIALGAFVVVQIGLHHDLLAAARAGEELAIWLSVAQIGGVIFGAGLPGWMLVRAVFTWMERRADKDIGELVRDARADIGSAIGGKQGGRAKLGVLVLALVICAVMVLLGGCATNERVGMMQEGYELRATRDAAEKCIKEGGCYVVTTLELMQMMYRAFALGADE